MANSLVEADAVAHVWERESETSGHLFKVELISSVRALTSEEMGVGFGWCEGEATWTHHCVLLQPLWEGVFPVESVSSMPGRVRWTREGNEGSTRRVWKEM